MSSRACFRLHVLILGLAGLALGGCSDDAPSGLRRTPPGDGASVRYDLFHKPLPDIPLPNDTATWPDPTSRTGRRVNASQVAPTELESVLRAKFDQLEGWGTYAPITLAFDKRDAKDPRPAIDLANVEQRHRRDDYELADDVIYVVNLRTGVPAPLDLGEGNFQYVVEDKGKYWRNDTRRWEQNLLWETYDETIDPLTRVFDPARTSDGTPAGLPVYRPEWDTDFDGFLDRPNLADPSACPSTASLLATLNDPNASEDAKADADAARDRCLTDRLLTWYERQTDSFIARPVVPLEERTEYAVVVTDRLRDADGKPVRSPFDFVYHPSQESGVARLREHLSNPALASYYGDIGGTGLDHVAFAWTYTTQPILEEMRLLRDGLYGKGPFASLGSEYPARFDLPQMVYPISPKREAEGVSVDRDWKSKPVCASKLGKPYVIDFAAAKPVIATLAGAGFGFTGPVLDDIVKSFDAISHLVIGTFDSPYFIEGGPQSKDPNASFNVDFAAGKAEHQRDRVPFILAVPKASAGHAQPFPVAYYGHGYTGATVEMLGFAGRMAQQGIASIAIDAVSHGLVLDESAGFLLTSLFEGQCLGPAGDGLLLGRAKDFDGDGVQDSGGDYWTSYLFHTRDVVRQSALDLVQMFRIMKSFDGVTRSGVDYDGDGDTAGDLAGDFDGDGTPDVGGKQPFHSWGQSLGGILAPFVGALDPQVVSAAPSAGAGGLLDVGARTVNGGAFEGIYLRQFGPLFVGVPPAELDPASTRCGADELSLRMIAVNVNSTAEVEFGCLPTSSYTNGATLFVHNRSNGETRCGRINPDGRFRVGIPTTAGDALELQLYDAPDAVDSYDHETGCHPTLGVERRVLSIDRWGKGVIARTTDDTLPENQRCAADDGCSRFASTLYAAGSALVAPTDGLGIIRQTPNLRRLLNVAANIIDAGDPANFAPYYALRTALDENGAPRSPVALLNIVQIGDQNVPLNAGVATGRAAGVVPFLRPDAITRYPALADYVTPPALYTELGGRTPNRVFLDGSVLEGIARLQRRPGTACGLNQIELTPADEYCHPRCSNEGSGDGCLDDQVCQGGRCVERGVEAARCKEYLFDIDAVDDGQASWGEQQNPTPLRLGRVAAAARPGDAASVVDVWAPRLLGKPGAPDEGAWAADRPVLAQLQSYIFPRGNHGIEPNDPCERWQTGRYFANLIARFFASNGRDLYYLSHPTSHGCLAKAPGAGGCEFVLDVK